MIRAYDEVYLARAQHALGRMMDTATYAFGMDPDAFFARFVSTGLAERFGRGEMAVIAGRSGAELARDVVRLAGLFADAEADAHADVDGLAYPLGRSEEYWAGWSLARYQWERALPFAQIVDAVPFSQIVGLYHPFHEMDVTSFVSRMDELWHEAHEQTALARARGRAGISQRMLADVSGVPVRSIQQYEQRQKDINKAQVQTVVSLARALCCKVEDLLELV